MAYNKVTYKYFLKAFYGKINKKKYKAQILKYNIHHTNVIAIQNALLIAKVPITSIKKKEFDVDIPYAEIM